MDPEKVEQLTNFLIDFLEYIRASQGDQLSNKKVGSIVLQISQLFRCIQPAPLLYSNKKYSPFPDYSGFFYQMDVELRPL